MLGLLWNHTASGGTLLLGPIMTSSASLYTGCMGSLIVLGLSSWPKQEARVVWCPCRGWLLRLRHVPTGATLR